MEEKQINLIALPKGNYEGYRVRIVDNTTEYQEAIPRYDFHFICEYAKKKKFLWWSWIDWYEFDQFLYNWNLIVELLF